MSEHEHEHDDDHDHDHEDSIEAALESESEAQFQLEIRRQNIELLKLAIEFTGYGGQHAPLKRHELKNALESVWDVFAEFDGYINPLPDEEGDDEGDEEDDDE